MYFRMSSTGVFEASTVVAGLDEVVVASDAVKQRGRHLGITEHGRPLPKAMLVVKMTEVRS